VNPEATWVILKEQRLHSRIADLLLVRVDVHAVEARLAGGWIRPMTLSELQVMRALRPDRNTTTDAVAQRLRVTPQRSSELLRGLAADGYAKRCGPRTFRRRAPVQPLVQRVVSFEAKRDDPSGAISQARGHRAWADETYVAFDATFERRFVAQLPAFQRLGVGLIELWPDNWSRVLHARPRRTSNRLEAGLIGERTLGRLTGSVTSDLPERRLPHGHRLPGASEPIVEGPAAEHLHGLLGSVLKL
jgi:DNA-binding MarR family transcriptional regulator